MSFTRSSKRAHRGRIWSCSPVARGGGGVLGAIRPTRATARIGRPIKTTARPSLPPNRRRLKRTHYQNFRQVASTSKPGRIIKNPWAYSQRGRSKINVTVVVERGPYGRAYAG